VSGSTLGAVLVLLAACGSAPAGGSGTRDPRDARDPIWRDPSSSRSDNFAPPRELDRGNRKDTKDYKGK
jgi:hypothetical protein